MQDIHAIKALIKDDIAAVDQLIVNELTSDVPLIQTIAKHIINSGGKRLRPLLLLLVANMFGIEGSEHHELAAVVEFIHTATLLHDDVVDKSDHRRGQESANVIWGNNASVLVGDFLYSRAFQILAKRSNVPVMRVLADTTNALSEGEMLQLTLQGEINTDIDVYYQVITCKTARLFEAACRIGAMLTGQDAATQQKLADYGLQLGLAFQIVDDVLDYNADAKTLGKDLGDDLAEGKMTLPLILTYQAASETEQQRIQEIITSAQPQQFLTEVIQLIATYHGNEQAIKLAEAAVQQGLNSIASLPEHACKLALISIIQHSCHRTV